MRIFCLNCIDCDYATSDELMKEIPHDSIGIKKESHLIFNSHINCIPISETSNLNADKESSILMAIKFVTNENAEIIIDNI